MNDGLDMPAPSWSRENGAIGGDVLLEPKLLSCNISGVRYVEVCVDSESSEAGRVG